MPKKIREIKSRLLDANFTWRQGKGSHTVWSHPLIERPITIARKDGDDAPPYLEKQVEKALKRIKELEDKSQ